MKYFQLDNLPKHILITMRFLINIHQICKLICSGNLISIIFLLIQCTLNEVFGIFNEKIMLDYSMQLLECSSTQKCSQFSEHRVLDTQLWNH
jgi:hypothetical protein